MLTTVSVTQVVNKYILILSEHKALIHGQKPYYIAPCADAGTGPF